jgi:spermidine synthase
VAIIGLGSGETAWAAGCRPETRSIRVFETAGPQLPLLRELARQEHTSGLDGLLRDPRLSVETGDGRFALQQGRSLYDVIEMDALTPYLGLSGNIYSVEFFRVCAARLKPGGLLCSWCPTPRVRNAIRATFPHVVAFEGEELLVAGESPIALEPDGWARRLADEAPSRYLGEPIRDEVRAALLRARSLPAGDDAAADMNRDLSPADEFLRPGHAPGRRMF